MTTSSPPTTPTLDVDRPRRRARRHRRRCGPTSSSTARPGPPSTPARATRPGLRGQRRSPCAGVAEGCDRAGAHARARSAPTTCSTGSLDRPYHEWDEPWRRSQRLRRVEAAGEREALALGTAATVVRTSWVMRRARRQHGDDHHAPGREQPELAFVDDQIGHPTFTADLAPMIRRLAVDRRSGVHHVTNQGPVSWFGFARAVATATGHDPARVAASPPPTSARRPAPPSGQQRARQRRP